MIKHDLKTIGAMFDIPGDFQFGMPYGSGHINDTFAVDYNQGGTDIRYIFQRINTLVFKRPTELMDNIMRVTTHIRSRLDGLPDSSRHTLTVIQADGQPYAIDAAGNYWRVYVFVEKALSYDIIESERQAFSAARAFGEFQADLVDMPGPRLHETIPGFHDTPSRYAALERAVAEDKCGRVASCRQEIDFALARKADASVLIDLMKSGDLPERITHNDTKLNNVLIDNVSGEGICVIDLDTVMPGLVHYDFGDMVRTATSPAAEDERELDRVCMRFDMFEALLRGYLSTAGDFLTPMEREYLPFSGKLIPLEIGVRFLTDYLDGDTYFKIHRQGHNLDRCRTQFKLVSSVEDQSNRMMRLLHEI
jgi:aminoglycoside phosphotransferase (APT) family kinase protein